MKNEYKVTLKLMESWAVDAMIGEKSIHMACYWCIVALFAAKFMMNQELQTYGILVIIYCCYRAFFRRFVLMYVSYRSFARIYGKKEWMSTVVFTEENIRKQEECLTITYEYSKLKDMKENRKTVKLIFNNSTSIVLYKDAFVDDTWEEFIRFLNRKVDEKQLNARIYPF